MIDVPKQAQLLLKATKAAPESTITAQDLSVLLMNGWPDPLPKHVAAAVYTGCSYVMNLGQIAYDSGSITATEHAAIQGVSELAMQIWKTVYSKLPEPTE